MTKKSNKYYAEIRICGFDNKTALVAAVKDAVEQIRAYSCIYDHRVIEVSMEKLKGELSSFSDWEPIKTPKKIRKVIGED